MIVGVSLELDPAWPERLEGGSGTVLLFVVAAVLAALTIWTYLGVPGATARRVLILLALRLACLAVACLAVFRPALAWRGDVQQTSTLVMVVDVSRSMATRDAGPAGGHARWDHLQTVLRDAQPVLRRLRERDNVNVVYVRFAADVGEFDPNNPGQPDGSRTDFGGMLAGLYNKYSSEGPVRGLFLLSDGGNNGTREAPVPWAAKWRDTLAPVYAIGFGRKDTEQDQKDIKVVGITTDPPEVPAKNELTVQGTIDAPGFKRAKVRIQLFVDEQPQAVDTLDMELPEEKNNTVRLKCLAPERPGKDGQMKVTLRVQPLPGEVSVDNNEASTFVRVLKEGISVLLVDRADGCWESQMFCRNALRLDKTIRLTTREFRDETAAGQADYFNFEHEHYDVIILGDVTAEQVRKRDPGALARMVQLVEQGTGLLMFAGESSLGSKSDWADTEIGKLLPVDLNLPAGARDVAGRVALVPRPDGWDHYVLRLADREKNAELWRAMPDLNGITRLGGLRRGAVVLADATVDVKLPDGRNQRKTEPLVVGLDDPGRRLVIGTDTTYRWVTNDQTRDNHRRFWQQAVLWLAHREDARGGVWIEPDQRRLATGQEFTFSTGLRNKRGEKVKGGTFAVRVLQGPKLKAPPNLLPQEKGQQGTFWNTDEPGDYELEVTGDGQDEAGEPIKDTASLRFHVYALGEEAAPEPARPDFLKQLVGDTPQDRARYFGEPKDLARFLQELEGQLLSQNRAKMELLPDWQGNRPAGLMALAMVFLLFVLLLALEWFLRRRWGLV